MPVPPKKNEAFSFTIAGLTSVADPDKFQINPTLAAGDVKVFKDGVAAGNIGTLPTAIDAGTELRITLAAAEMNVTDVLVSFNDVAGDQWQSYGIEIFPATVQMEDIPTTAEIWAHTPRTPTTSAASVAAALAGSDINILRGDTLSVTLTGLGNIADRSKLWLTLKKGPGDTDSEAIVQVTEAGGLIVLNAAVAVTSTDSTLVVDDEVAGDITWTLKAAAAFELLKWTYDYDVQVLRTTGVVNTLTEGDAVVSLDTTKAIA